MKGCRNNYTYRQPFEHGTIWYDLQQQSWHVSVLATSDCFGCSFALFCIGSQPWRPGILKVRACWNWGWIEIMSWHSLFQWWFDWWFDDSNGDFSADFFQRLLDLDLLAWAWLLTSFAMRVFRSASYVAEIALICRRCLKQLRCY